MEGRPTLAFEAKRLREATQLCAEPWLRDDLIELKSNGVPLCSAESKLRARTSNAAEIAVHRDATRAPTSEDDILLTYLVKIDGLEANGK